LTTIDPVDDGRDTVIAALALFPSAPALMLTGPPAAIPVTTPVALTAAIAGVALVHTTVFPGSTAPAAFFATAPNVSVPPIEIVALGGETVMLATAVSGPGGAVTLTVELPETAAVVALIVALPGANAVTVPLASTDAIVGAELDQANASPARVAPVAL
jgi:hypothetical protein